MLYAAHHTGLSSQVLLGLGDPRAKRSLASGRYPRKLHRLGHT